MMTFQKFIESIQEQTHQTEVNDQLTFKGIPPPLISMTRQSIRQFTDGTSVALYWSHQIGRYFTIVFH